MKLGRGFPPPSAVKEVSNAMRIIKETQARPKLFFAILVAAFFLTGNTAFPQCGSERWPVKTGTDQDAALVNLNAVTPSTITYLAGLPAPVLHPSSGRLRPIETTVFQLTCTLLEYKLEADSDYHLVLSDESGRTMIAEIPSPSCVGPSSPFASAIARARAAFEAKYHATKAMHTANEPVQITGVGFFDFIHGQTGVAPNGIELHPVLSISWGQPAPALTVSEESPIIASRPPLTNTDILTLASAGLSTDVLLAKIRTSTPRFDTSTNALIELKKAGVSPEVITEMVYRQAGAPSPGATGSAPSKQAAVAGTPTGSGAAATTSQGDPNVTVYVTASGKKYHTQGCSSLRSSSIPMKLSDAVAAGYTPCSRCNPPTLDKANTSTASSGAPKQGASANPSDKPTGETTASGLPIYEGPHGGHYHYSKSGKKVYDHKK
jgi:hypothetical protein